MKKYEAIMMVELMKHFWIMVSMIVFGLYAMDIVDEVVCGVSFIVTGVALFNGQVITALVSKLKIEDKN